VDGVASELRTASLKALRATFDDEHLASRAEDYLAERGYVKFPVSGKIRLTELGELEVETGFAMLDDGIARADGSRVDEERGRGIVGEAPLSGIEIFVSHSSRDEKLAEELVELLCAALKLSKSQIRATSVHGCKLPGGADTPEQLRTDIAEAKVVLAVLTQNAVESQYVLFELGAGWGLERRCIPLAGPDSRKSTLRGTPLADLNVLETSVREDVQQLLSDIAQTLSLELEPVVSKKTHAAARGSISASGESPW